MPFNPSGLPTVPTCESDVARWAEQMQSWVISKLSAAHSEIDDLAISPFDICAELGVLSAPSCLVPATGINNTEFTYAEEGDTVVAGSGVLPWPGTSAGPIADTRQGSKECPDIDKDSWSQFTVQISPALPHANYHVLFVNAVAVQCDVHVHSRTTSSFVFSVIGRKTESQTAKLRWLLLLMPEA